jgi:hypothetical protein
VAFGKFLKNDRLYEPTSSLVERFLLRDFRIINPTLSLRRTEADIRIIETVMISTARIFPILRNIFIYLKEISVCGLNNRRAKVGLILNEYTNSVEIASSLSSS